MSADIPAMPDEIPCAAPPSSPSRRWLRSPWTWFASLVCLLGLMALLEMRVLWNEAHIAQRLQQRGYAVQYIDGWLRRQMAREWQPSVHLCGDRIKLVIARLKPLQLEPLDDLIPELRSLSSLDVVQFISLSSESITTSQGSIDDFLTTFQTVGGIKSVYLSNFGESQLSEELVHSLNRIEVEQVFLYYCRSNDADVLRFKSLPRLNTLYWRGWPMTRLSHDVVRELHNARPDLIVKDISR